MKNYMQGCCCHDEDDDDDDDDDDAADDDDDDDYCNILMIQSFPKHRFDKRQTLMQQIQFTDSQLFY